MNLTSEDGNSLSKKIFLNEEVSVTIQRILTEYVEKNINLSLRSIADKDESPLLHREYVRRLGCGEIKSKKLDFDKVLKVLSIVSNKKSVFEILEYYSDPSYHSLQSYIKSFIGVSSRIQDFEIENICFENESSSVAYCMASSSQGVSIEMLRSVLGDKGVVAAEKLLTLNIFYRTEEFYHLNEEFRVTPSSKKRIELVKYFINHYKIENTGELNYLLCGYSSMNEKGIAAKRELFQYIHVELNKINNDLACRGDVPMYEYASMDTFMPLPLEIPKDDKTKEEEEELKKKNKVKNEVKYV